MYDVIIAVGRQTHGPRESRLPRVELPSRKLFLARDSHLHLPSPPQTTWLVRPAFDQRALLDIAANNMTNAAATDVEDDDPVVAEYDVFITPEMEQQQLYVLQYINRPPDQPFTKATQSEPAELRVKKESGFVEVDVPIDIHHNYNRPAGVRWGEALRKTKGFGQRAYGIASGFERTMPRATNRTGAGEGAPAAPAAAEDDDNFEDYVTNFEDANEKGHVLNVQTFGGQIPKDDGKGPSYMLGTFRDGRL